MWKFCSTILLSIFYGNQMQMCVTFCKNKKILNIKLKITIIVYGRRLINYFNRPQKQKHSKINEFLFFLNILRIFNFTHILVYNQVMECELKQISFFFNFSIFFFFNLFDVTHICMKFMDRVVLEILGCTCTSFLCWFWIV